MKRVTKMRLHAVMVAGIAVVLVGCVTTGKHVRWYEGAPLAPSEVAMLKVRRTMEARSLAFVEIIDGVPLGKGKRHIPNTTKEIELMPGTHTLEVAYGDTKRGRSLSNAV